MVEFLPSKQATWVRFPPPAPSLQPDFLLLCPCTSSNCPLHNFQPKKGTRIIPQIRPRPVRVSRRMTWEPVDEDGCNSAGIENMRTSRWLRQALNEFSRAVRPLKLPSTAPDVCRDQTSVVAPGSRPSQRQPRIPRFRCEGRVRNRAELQFQQRPRRSDCICPLKS